MSVIFGTGEWLLLGGPIKLSSMFRGIKSTVTHHGEQNVAAPSCQGDKRLVVSLPLAHFACVVSPGYRISERGEGEQEQRPFEAFIAPSRGMFPTYG